MEQTIAQIFDKTVKKVLTLSSTATINFINGAFDTHFPLDSQITYNWTEFEDSQLVRTLADTILTINGTHSFHIEAQMSKDDDITIRIFEYGYQHALRTGTFINDECHVHIPEPIIIYLYYEGNVPDHYTIHYHFGEHEQTDFNIPVLKIPEISTQELNDRKMVILIPFQLLKLRKILKKERSPDNLLALKNLLQHDILDSINENQRAGNITVTDAQQLISYTKRLYDYLYSHYKELEVFNDMMDESYMTDADLIVKACEEKLEKAIAAKQQELTVLEQQIAHKDIILAEREHTIAERENTIAEKENTIIEKENTIIEKENTIIEKENTITKKNNTINEKNIAIAERDNEIAMLKAQLAALQNRNL